MGIHMTLVICGMAFSDPVFWYKQVTTQFLAFRSLTALQVYKHVFTSPSSVEKEPKATRSGNARIHRMTNVTPASIAYIATQVS